MAIYNYKNATLIDCVEITSPRPTITQATLIASQRADKADLDELRRRLGRMGYSTLMDSKDGRTLVQVRGVKDEKSFIAALEKLDLSHNGVEKDLMQLPEKTPSFTERVRGKSLFLSALFYDLGNIAFMISGYQRGRHNPDGKMTSNDKSEALTGVAFMVGDVLMSFYGHEKDDDELLAASQGLKRHLHQKGIEIPRGEALNPNSLYQRGVLKATHHWLHKHIGSIKCLTELAGGLFMIHSGCKVNPQTKHYNHDKMVAGALLTVGWASTFLLEKPRGHKILDNKEPDGLMEQVKSNPRGWIAAPLAMGNNLFNLKGAYNMRQDALNEIEKVRPTGNAFDLKQAQAKRHDYLYNVVTACSFLVANGLFGLSGSKGPKATEDDKAVMNDLVLLGANVLAQQPELVRNASLDETADYISNLAHISLDKEQIKALINDKVNNLAHSSWAARVQPSPTQPQSPSLA